MPASSAACTEFGSQQEDIRYIACCLYISDLLNTAAVHFKRSSSCHGPDFCIPTGVMIASATQVDGPGGAPSHSAPCTCLPSAAEWQWQRHMLPYFCTCVRFAEAVCGTYNQTTSVYMVCYIYYYCMCFCLF